MFFSDFLKITPKSVKITKNWDYSFSFILTTMWPKIRIYAVLAL
jgi:hypothetical protein